MTGPKKGDRCYVVDDMTEDMPTIRVRQVRKAGEKRVQTIGPQGARQHELVATHSGAQSWRPPLYMSPEQALEAFIRDREAAVEMCERRGRRAAAELAHARRLLEDYQTGAECLIPSPRCVHGAPWK